MLKYKVLAHNEKLLTELGIRFDRISQDKNEFFSSVFPCCLLIISISGLISSSVFIYTNLDHPENIFQASIVFIAMLQSGGMFFSFGCKIKLVKAVHCRLQEIIDEIGKLADY